MSSSESIEASAATIDQAIGQALEQLGAEHDDVTVEVLSTPRSGVLGLGARQARVRVTRRAPAGARSGVMSPPPAPPLQTTPPEMRRPAEPSRAAPPRPPERAEAAGEARRDQAPPRGAERGEPGGQDERGRERNAPEAQGRGEHREERREDRREERREPPRGGQGGQGRNERRPRRDVARGESNEAQGRGREERSREERPREERARDDKSGEERSRGDRSRDERRNPARATPPEERRSGAGNEPRGQQGRGSGAETPRRGRGSEAAGGYAAGGFSGGRGPAQDAPERTATPRDRDMGRDEDRDPFAGVDDSGNDPRKIADLQEQAREAEIFLKRLLELMGEEATIEPAESDDPETLELNIKGDGSGILIGRHGQTLDAIEYMVNRLLARKIKDAAPISIDTESYRARRRRLLQRMALSKGEQAKREHVAVTLDPMPPRDRRIVHLALKDDPMIATRSTGDGFVRPIQIVPVDERRDPNERRNENRGRGRDREHDQDRTAIGEQGGFKHGQKRIV
jgi:spoIIIJ-associated protein